MAGFSSNCVLAVPKQLDPSPWMTPSSVSSASSSPDPDAHQADLAVNAHQQITLHNKPSDTHEPANEIPHHDP
ncbi:hypothetical protein ACLOJK_018947, partial [Asimina triloba]